MKVRGNSTDGDWISRIGNPPINYTEEITEKDEATFTALQSALRSSMVSALASHVHSTEDLGELEAA